MKKMKKMKNLLKYLCAFTLIGSFIACEDDSKAAFTLHTEADNTAPYVRANVNQRLVGKSLPIADEVITMVIDVPINNVDTWSLQVKLTRGGTDVTSLSDVISVSSFPTTLSYTITEIAAFMGLTLNDIQGADVIEFVGTSKGTDGRILTASNLAGDLSGQPEQLNAYSIDIAVFCNAVSGNFTGDWTLNLNDTFGDGWDGAFITATVDGVDTKYTVDSGFGQIHIVTIANSAALLVWSYTSGRYEEEHNFTITDPAGVEYGLFNGATGIPFCFF